MKHRSEYTLLLLTIGVQVFGQDHRLRVILANGDSLAEVSIDSLKGTTAVITTIENSRHIPIDSIAYIYERHTNKVVRGIAIGAVAGAALGFVSGEIIDNTNDKPEPPTLSFSGQGPPEYGPPARSSDKGTNYVVIMPIAVGVVGAVTGAILGRPRDDEVIDLTGKTVDEKRAILGPQVKKRR